ncbi:hypothetical protein L916_15937, partial [Phytophthora nicotianae]
MVPSTFGLEQCSCQTIQGRDSAGKFLERYATVPRCWKRTRLFDYYNCVYEEPDEDDAMSAKLATMLSRLYIKDPMSVDELLNPPDENTAAEDFTHEDFCGVGDQELAVDGSDNGSENMDEDDMERCTWIEEGLELKSISCGSLSFSFVQ